METDAVECADFCAMGANAAVVGITINIPIPGIEAESAGF